MTRTRARNAFGTPEARRIIEAVGPCARLGAAQEVDQATCVRLEDHLSRCPRCTEACDSLKRTVSLCRRIPGDEVPAPVRAAVRQALRHALPA